jgi:1-aminocyclopropane-1-carboxylate synthase
MSTIGRLVFDRTDVLQGKRPAIDHRFHFSKFHIHHSIAYAAIACEKVIMSFFENSESGLSSRGRGLSEDGKTIRTHYNAVWGNLYNAESPNGIIDMGTSDNYFMGQYIADFINENVTLSGSDVDYGSGSWGTKRLRGSMAKFMTKWFKAREQVSADDIVFATGCTSLCEILGFALFEPGDGILLSMPIYHSFKRDFGLRSHVKTVFVPAGDVDEFSMERVKQYEEAVETAAKTGTKIRVLLICNPHNPLGRCYPPEVLQAYMELCERLKIHLLMDEIYAFSMYKPLTDEPIVPFTSILTFDTDKFINKNRLHLLYGFSKDFSAAGLRLGCLWSRNTDLMSAVSGQSFFSYPSTIADKIAATILENEAWLEEYVQKNQEAIRSCAKTATELLEEISIPYIKGAYAGFFFLLDLRGFVPGKKPEEVTWDDEIALKARIRKENTYLTSGQGLSYEKPCFFRLCFMRERQVMEEGIKRLHTALKDTSGLEKIVLRVKDEKE